MSSKSIDANEDCAQYHRHADNIRLYRVIIQRQIERDEALTGDEEEILP